MCSFCSRCHTEAALPSSSSIGTSPYSAHRTVTRPCPNLPGPGSSSPIDEGKKPFFAALRSSVDSSARPTDSGISSRLSSSSVSPLCSGGAPAGIRKPVRYQFDGRTHPGSRSDARSWPAPGPIRSRFRASTRRSRTLSESIGAPSIAAMMFVMPAGYLHLSALRALPLTGGITLPAIRKTQDRFCRHLSLPHGSMSGVRALIFTTDGEHNITAPPS